MFMWRKLFHAIFLSLCSLGIALGGVPVTLALPSTEGTALGDRALGEHQAFETLGVADGLTHATVFTVLQDRHGFLWIGTIYGLNRYDGLEIRPFHHDPGDPRSLGAEGVSDLLEDRDGTLWIATWGGGLDRFDAVSETFVHHPPGIGDPAALQDGRVQTLFECRDGTLWIGTYAGGLSRRDPGIDGFQTLRHDPADPTSLPHDRVWALAEDVDGGLWIGTHNGLMLRPRGAAPIRFGVAEGLSHARIRALHVDAVGSLWVGTERGVDRYDPARRRFTPVGELVDAGLGEAAINRLTTDAFGRLWVGTAGEGLVCFDPIRGAVDIYRPDPDDPAALRDDDLRAVVTDRSDVLWIGTLRSGLAKLDLKPSKFRHVGAGRGPQALAHPWVRDIARGADGVLWVGTDGGLDRVDEAAGRITHFRQDPGDPSALPGSGVRRILPEPSGDLWLSVWDRGLAHWRGGRMTAFYAPDEQDPASLAHSMVHDLVRDASGILWLATRGGLDRFDPVRPEKGFTHFRHHPGDPHSLPDDFVRDLESDPSGGLWVGTDLGLCFFDRIARTCRRERLGDSVVGAARGENGAGDGAAPRITALRIDPEGGLWVGTTAGLYRRTGQDVAQRYTNPSGAPSNRITAILPGADGELWLSTYGGLVRFEPRFGTFRTYRAFQGLQSDRFSEGAAFRDLGGELLFGGDNGLTIFHPNEVLDNPHPPPVVLVGLRIGGEPLALDVPLAELADLELSHAQGTISFELAALDFTDPRHNLYRSRLEGLDPAWTTDGGRMPRYTELPPGDYVFRAQAANSDGVWNEDGYRLAVHVEPPWWGTWTFRIGAAISLVLLGWSGLSWRLRHLRRRERELAVINAELQGRIVERDLMAQERDVLISTLERKNAELERFAYTFSHDLRGPLLTIKTFLGSVLTDAERGNMDRLRSDLQRIFGAADKIRQLLDGLLAISRVGLEESGTYGPVRLDRVAQKAIERARLRIKWPAVELVVKADLGLIQGEKKRLVEVVEELLVNAVRFLRDQPAPRIEIGTVEVSSVDGDERAVYVADNGIGVEPRHQRHIFGLFNTLDPDSEGTGVGLALVERIIEGLGGRVWVESEGRSKGSVFYFTVGDPAREANSSSHGSA